MKILILYWSSTKNTEKVSNRIADTLKKEGKSFEIVKVEKDFSCNLFDYNLHRREGNVKLCCPKVSGKYAVCYCTYSGPHTGIREAIPAVLYMGQFFEHLGFTVAGEWYTVGEFKGIEKASLQGKLGDIRGRPNEDDLLDIDNKVREVLKEVEIANEL